MNRLKLLTVIVLVWALNIHAQGPNEGFILEDEATRHLVVHPDPIYPAIAKAARLQGVVLIHADVNEQGAVTKVEAIGGPPMLRSSAIDAVNKWRYRPFETDGKPVAVKIVVSVAFSLGIPAATEKSDQAISQAYFPLDERCRDLLAKDQWSDAVSVCHDAATVADRFPVPRERANEIRVTHQSYGQALAFSGDQTHALSEFKLVVDMANKSLKPINAEYGTAYFWLAFAEHASGMPIDAERDYTTAVASYRLAIVDLPDMKTIYSRYLAHALAYHSVLAMQTGHPDEARKMQEEALQLDSHSLDGLSGAN